MTTLCESHSKLLAALKAALDIVSEHKNAVWFSDDELLAIDTARTAISRAEAIRDEPPTDAELLREAEFIGILNDELHRSNSIKDLGAVPWHVALAAMRRVSRPKDAPVSEHKIEIKRGNLDYLTVTCSCGWQGGTWASYENARWEMYKHETAVKDHIAPFGVKK
jgi:hypothetical protein